MLWFLALAACTPTAAPDPCRPVYIGQVPLLHFGPRLFVPSTVNGKAVTLLLDTGGAVSIMSAPHASALNLTQANLPALPPVPTIFGLGGVRTVHVMRADSMQVGDLSAGATFFVVPDQSPLRIVNQDPDTLAMNFLASLDLDVDVLGDRLLFYKAAQFCAAPQVVMSRPFYGVPEVFSARPDRPIVTASIRGIAFRTLLDTGSPGSVLFHDAAQRLGLSADAPAPGQREELRGFGLNTVETVRHLSEPITIGGLTVSQMRIDVSPDNDPAVDIVLGMNFLRRVHLWISNSSREVVLQYPAKAGGTLYRR